jgi:hypothetical protein
MRRLVILMVLVIATLFLFMPMRKVRAFPAVRYYKVYWSCESSCLVSPSQCGNIVGEWTRYCDDSWEGEGRMPGDSCTYYDVTIGEWCDF